MASTARSRSSRSRERPRRARRALRWGGALLLLAVVFFAGLAVGKAIESVPESDNQQLFRTLVPTTLTPRVTVTVTVSKP